ncbi:MAG: endonuclease/exonuclease/phosphatase family protein [Isosphaerales bacterium]
MAWNINHRIREKVIPDQMTEAIVSLGPDVIVLTEYVHGPSRDGFLASLAHHGFRNWLVSDCRPRENHMLIAARTAIEPGPIRAPEIAPSVPSNALHVRLPDEGVEILGLRVPDYSKDPKTKRACWDWIIEMAASVKDLPFVLIGDFNTDPKYPPSRCGDRIKRLTDDGWQLAFPPDRSSFWTLNGDAVHIDHAFVSGLLHVEGASYVTKFDRHVFAGNESGALSDHAVLLVDITRDASFLPPRR